MCLILYFLKVNPNATSKVEYTAAMFSVVNLFHSCCWIDISFGNEWSCSQAEKQKFLCFSGQDKFNKIRQIETAPSIVFV